MLARITVSGEPSADASADEPVRPSTVSVGIYRGIGRSNGAIPVALCWQMLYARLSTGRRPSHCRG